MTTPSLGRLLISHITLRGPELAHLYALIAARPGLHYDELVATLVPTSLAESLVDLAEAPLREALNFLLIAGMVTQQGSNRRKALFQATPDLPTVPFPLLLLHHIRRQTDARQRAIVLIYAHLVAQDTLATTASNLRDQMERTAFRNLFAWTGEKIGLWIHLAHFIGLVRRLERSSEIPIVPQPALVAAALHWAGLRPGVVMSLDSCLRTIDSTFFACFTQRGRVHRGLAQTLLAMEQLGQLQLRHRADAVHSVMLAERRVSDVRLLLPSNNATLPNAPLPADIAPDFPGVVS